MPTEQSLFEPETINSFHCPLHGTVKACPWQWMDCQKPNTVADRSDVTDAACTRCWFRHKPRCQETETNGTTKETRPSDEPH
jgi:hypothetical protein